MKPEARPDARPDARPAIRMQWSDLLFVHWRVDADALRPLVPAPLEVDTHDGNAWVGLVPFTMPVIRPRWVPPLSVRGLTRFHECNVRTYVTLNGEPGVWFFSLDAASPPAVWSARRFWHLPYYRARISLEHDDGIVRYAVRRTSGPTRPTMRCAWRTGPPRAASRPGELAWFLTERYWMFARRGERMLKGRVHHEPWPLLDADLLDLDDGLVAAAGIAPDDQPPLVFAARPLDVVGWPLEPA